MGELAEHQGDGARAPEEELRPPRKHERSDRAGALASRGTRAARERGVAGRAQGSLAGRGELQDARHGHRTGGRATMEMGDRRWGRAGLWKSRGKVERHEGEAEGVGAATGKLHGGGLGLEMRERATRQGWAPSWRERIRTQGRADRAA